MTTNILPIDGLKRRRIMIITDDENILNQIQTNNSTTFLKSIVLEQPRILEPEISSSTFVHHQDDDLLEKYPSFTSVDFQFEQQQQQQHQQKKKKIHTPSLTCVVCGAPAFGHNFDAITCESCKAFFRRNALKDPATIECRRKRACDITFETRRRCTACRLVKCFQKGMRRDRLLTEEQREAKRLKLESNRNLTLHSHDESQSSSSSSSSPIDDASILLLTDFTDLLPQTSIIENNRTLLSVEELQSLENIQFSYQHRIELAAREGLPWNPSTHATTLLQHINGRSVTALRLLSFFKQIPEFHQLNIEDKVILIKYNLMSLTCMNASLSYKIETDQVIESDTDEPWNTNVLQKFHGIDISRRVKKIFNSFISIAQYDQRIIQLSLIVLMLTKGFSTLEGGFEPVLNNGMAVYRAQSYYTELLWKYMETQHGSEQAVRIFSALVAHFVTWQTIHRELHCSLRRILTTADINDMLPIMKSLLLFS